MSELTVNANSGPNDKREQEKRDAKKRSQQQQEWWDKRESELDAEAKKRDELNSATGKQQPVGMQDQSTVSQDKKSDVVEKKTVLNPQDVAVINVVQSQNTKESSGKKEAFQKAALEISKKAEPFTSDAQSKGVEQSQEKKMVM